MTPVPGVTAALHAGDALRNKKKNFNIFTHGDGFSKANLTDVNKWFLKYQNGE